jgi:hypothetical protein
MGSFRVGQITINLAGEQTFTTLHHPVTRDGKATEVLVVGAGKLLVYVYDLPAARAFATAARCATNYVPTGFAARAVAAGTLDDEDPLAPAILLRFASSPRVNRVQGFGAGHGTPRVRIQTDHLTVHLFDRASLDSWANGWAEVEQTAKRLWPDPALVDHAEARERLRIARTGRVTARPAV